MCSEPFNAVVRSKGSDYQNLLLKYNILYAISIDVRNLKYYVALR